MSEGFDIINGKEFSTESPRTYGVEHAKLSKVLAIENMRVTAVILEFDGVVGIPITSVMKKSTSVHGVRTGVQ